MPDFPHNTGPLDATAAAHIASKRAQAMQERRSAPQLADSARDDGRAPQRDPVYRAPRPRDRRFEVPDYMRRRGLDYFWAAELVLNQKNPMLRNYAEAGWRLARAKDYPEIAGLGGDVDQDLMELGMAHKAGPDDPIRDSGMILLVRDQALSDRSRRNDLYEANRQINDKMNVMRAISEHAIGPRTQLERKMYVSDRPPADLPETEAHL
jgi:hypothetical protein